MVKPKDAKRGARSGAKPANETVKDEVQILRVKSVADLKKLIEETPVLLLELSGEHCCWCRKLEESLKTVLPQLPDIKFVQIITDMGDELGKWREDQGCMGIPQIWLYKKGKKVDEIVGYKDSATLLKTFKQWLK